MHDVVIAAWLRRIAQHVPLGVELGRLLPNLGEHLPARLLRRERDPSAFDRGDEVADHPRAADCPAHVPGAHQRRLRRLVGVAVRKNASGYRALGGEHRRGGLQGALVD